MAADSPIAEADWPLFGWCDDVRPALQAAMAAGQPAVLATLYRVAGSAPRGAGAQMLFAGTAAFGYFSGDCIEGDVARHAAEVLHSARPQRLHYGHGSPWIDIRLRCGGALHVLLERIGPECTSARQLLDHAARRVPCHWHSDGKARMVTSGGDGPLLLVSDDPFGIVRRCDPPRRLVVSGGDPGALALAQLGVLARFETFLLRPDGPVSPPPLADVTYLRDAPADALARLGVDRWTAFIGATHEDQHDLAGCLTALRGGAAWVGMIGARSRADGRRNALRAVGADDDELSQLHLSPGVAGLGKAPWEVATGIIAQVLGAMNPSAERA